MTREEAHRILEREARGLLSLTERRHIQEIGIAVIRNALAGPDRELAQLPPPPAGDGS